MHAFCEQQRRASMAEIMEAQGTGCPHMPKQRLERAGGKVLRVHGGSLLRREHKIIILPEGTQPQVFLTLTLTMASESHYSLLRETDAAPLAVLGSFEPSAVAGLRVAAAHGQCSSIQIEVIPLESQQLARS